MEKRVTGAIFCGISALLFATRYVVAALLNVARFSGQDVWGGGDALTRFWSFYSNSLKEMRMLLVLSIVALVVGIAYLIWGEYEARTISRGEQKKHPD